VCRYLAIAHILDSPDAASVGDAPTANQTRGTREYQTPLSRDHLCDLRDRDEEHSSAEQASSHLKQVWLGASAEANAVHVPNPTVGTVHSKAFAAAKPVIPP
jgi:hypothetical protein